MEIVVAGEVPMRDHRSVRGSGFNAQVLLQDDTTDGLNFVLRRNHFIHTGSDTYGTPRHRHGFQQIRYAESGDINFAPGQDIPQGDIAYFPRGAYYGPQRKEQGVQVSIQFGFFGEHQKGKVWESFRPAALERLSARGTIENGLFIEADPETGEKRQRDAVEAIYEEQYEMRYGKKKRLVIPPARYESAILMHTHAFEYYEIAPGVEMRRLGQFYDHTGPEGDTRVSMIRLSGKGVHRLGPERAQTAWSISAGLNIDGRVYPEVTCLYSPRHEDVTLSGEGGVELIVVEFPRLD
jgi:hypothetical protein